MQKIAPTISSVENTININNDGIDVIEIDISGIGDFKGLDSLVCTLDEVVLFGIPLL